MQRKFSITATLICLMFMSFCIHPYDSSEPYGCDNYRESEGCVMQTDPIVRYSFEAPLPARKDWRALSYYMYFHSRQTPGLRLDFNRNLSKEEQQYIEKKSSCHYSIHRPNYTQVSGEMEGLRLTRDGLWCFDYLGAMLLVFLEANQLDQKKVDLQLFPVHLEIVASLPASVDLDSVQVSRPEIKKSIHRKVYVDY